MGGAHRFEVKQRVGQRQAGIDGVAGRAAIASREIEPGSEERRVAVEVGTRGAALEAAQTRAANARFRRLGERVGHTLACIEQGLADVGAAGLRLLQQAVLTTQLGHHQLPCPIVAEGMVHGAPRLRQSHRGLVVRGPEHDRHLAAGARAQQQGGRAGFGELEQHTGVELGARALDDDAVDEA